MNIKKNQALGFSDFPTRIRISRGTTFGFIILGALIAFELFNYSSTEYALEDLLGNLSFLGIAWATILALAFCGIDFAGIARLHTPSEQTSRPNETWYLFGAWLLAATMNAMLTWWGVSLAIVSHETLGNAIVERETLIKVVPIFVAVLVWLIRVLIIGTYSLAGTRLLSQIETHPANSVRYPNEAPRTASTRSLGSVPVNNQQPSNASYRGSTRSNNNYSEPTYNRPDPVYTPVQTANANRPTSSEPIDRTYNNKPGITR